MLNLNLNFPHEDINTAVRGEVEESVTSNSSNVNAECCSPSNVGDDDSLSVAGDGDNFHCFNFDILKVGDTGIMNVEDRMSQSQSEPDRSEFLTRTLFPMRHENLMLLPNPNNNNQLREMQNVQLVKPNVQQSHVVKKSRRGPRSRSSQYRGVTFYRRTGRWESHIWDCGKQVYLGGFDTAHSAARAYDRAAIKFRGVDADINFNISDYEEDMNQIKNLSKEEFVHMLRRHSNGFSRGGSKYRGVTMTNGGLSEARLGQSLGNKAYENAAILPNELVTNFEANTYEREAVASHYGSAHDLDLNLCISTPSCHGNSASRNKNLQAGNPCTTRFQGIPIISDHSQSWAGIYPQSFGGPSQGSSNWAWQPYGQSQTPTAFFTAASSGFPAPAAPNSVHHN